MQQFVVPPRMKTRDGQPRRVGFELEFAGVELESAAVCVSESVKGTLEKQSEAVYLVSSETLGEFRIELDWSYVKDTAEDRALQRGVSAQDDPVMKWVTRLAGKIVPVEVVCPPIDIDQLAALDEMVIRLRDAGALGTEQSLLYAFGLHLNPELPDMTAAVISRYLQSFVLAEEWLVSQHRVDFSRRVTPYIDIYPVPYGLLVMHYDDDVDLDQLVSDYLIHNPTRNRALDMLPLFLEVRPDLVIATLEDPRINARPTFHYRLPNCEIEQPQWSLSHSWNLWCVVEHLATEDDIRNDLIGRWREQQADLLNFKDNPWHRNLDKIYRDLLSV